MDKKLLTPGPLTTSMSTKEAMLHDWGSRDQKFIDLNQSIRDSLIKLIDGEGNYQCVPMQGSGTFAVESMISSLTPKDANVLILINGAYGQRMKKMCGYLNRNMIEYEVAEHEPHNITRLEEIIDANKQLTHVFAVYCETTSGILNPINDIADLVKKKNLSRKFKKRKILSFKYIIYSGSYKYLPNKNAIDYLVNVLMPKLIKKFPKLKLILTGGGYVEKKNYIINFGIVSKPKLLNLIYNSKLMVVPIDKGTGTRIKIIEAMLIGAKILTTKKGIEGISFKKNKFPIVLKKQLFYKSIINNLKYNIKIKKIDQFKKNYTMESIVNDFLRNKYVAEFFKTI